MAPEAAEASASVRAASDIWERDSARQEDSQARSAERTRAASRARAPVPSPEQVRLRFDRETFQTGMGVGTVTGGNVAKAFRLSYEDRRQSGSHSAVRSERDLLISGNR